MAETFNSHIKNVAYAYTKLLRVTVTKTTLQSVLEENPYYPSLLSLSDTFSRFSIPNAAYTVSNHEIEQLSVPFIAYLQMPKVGSDFVLVTQMNSDTVDIIYDKNKPKSMQKTDFISRFKNVALIAEPTTESGEDDYAAQLRKENRAANKRLMLILTAILMYFSAIVINVLNNWSASYIVIAAIKFVGLITTVLLLVYENDKSNEFVKNICTAGSKTNCDAVLSSKAAKIWGISWAEIGFFYFAFTTLLLLIQGCTSSN